MYTLLFIFLGICTWFFFRKKVNNINILRFKINKQLKSYVIIPSVILLLIIFIFFYIRLDKQQYYYGLSCIFCDNKLPYHLKPQIDRYYNFSLNDEDDFELVANGFRYEKSDTEIKDFLGYGYNKTSILVKYKDSLNVINYLTSYKTGYNSSKGNPEISFKVIKETDFKQLVENYTWFNLNKDKVDKIRFYRTLVLLSVILILVLLWQLIRTRKVTC